MVGQRCSLQVAALALLLLWDSVHMGALRVLYAKDSARTAADDGKPAWPYT